MAITTVDVVTAAHSDVETLKNATTVVTCQRTGEYDTANAEFETSLTYNALESKYTTRFDNVGYYVTPNVVDGGGA